MDKAMRGGQLGDQGGARGPLMCQGQGRDALALLGGSDGSLDGGDGGDERGGCRWSSHRGRAGVSPCGIGEARRQSTGVLLRREGSSALRGSEADRETEQGGGGSDAGGRRAEQRAGAHAGEVSGQKAGEERTGWRSAGGLCGGVGRLWAGQGADAHAGEVGAREAAATTLTEVAAAMGARPVAAWGGASPRQWGRRPQGSHPRRRRWSLQGSWETPWTWRSWIRWAASRPSLDFSSGLA